MDWDENHNFNHAMYTGGRDLVKGLTASAIGTYVGMAALCFPGVGWIGAGCLALIVGYFVATGLDSIDELAEDNGFIPKWAKLDEPAKQTNKLIIAK